MAHQPLIPRAGDQERERLLQPKLARREAPEPSPLVALDALIDGARAGRRETALQRDDVRDGGVVDADRVRVDLCERGLGIRRTGGETVRCHGADAVGVGVLRILGNRRCDLEVVDALRGRSLCVCSSEHALRKLVRGAPAPLFGIL